jgi:hypothetical protein
MPVPFFSSLKSLLLFLLHVCLAALFGLLTWVFWGLYQDERAASRYDLEGQKITVTVTAYSTNKQDWKDNIQNAKYIYFSFRGKRYSTRFVEDSTWVSEGSKVRLLYSSKEDAFRQERKVVYNPRSNVSKLIGWTSISLLSKRNIALISFLLVAIIFFFLLAGLLARIPGLSFITSVSAVVFKVLLLIGLIYLSYNAYAYYQYYNRLKTFGQQQQVTVVDKNKHYLLRNSRNTPFRIIYTATVSFQNEERVIPVSEEDFSEIDKGSWLDVLYSTEVDDMMSVDYQMNPLIFIFTGLTWLLFLFYIIRKVTRRRNGRDTGKFV